MRVYAEAITIAADLKDSRQASYGEKKSAAELELEASKDVEERPAGVITGQLRLQDGTPVVGVPVTTIPVISNKEVPNAFQTARTDKAGRYRFNVPFGSYRVTANHDEGFSAVSSRDQTTAVEVLSAVAVTADFYFAVITVRGRVILPENQLLNGVEVVISPDFGLSAPKTTAVSRDGFFEFRGLLPNSYHVRTNYPSTGSFIKVTDGDVTGLEFNLLPVTAKEVTLVETLTRMRTAIWRYRTERNEAPQTLDDLVTARLIPQVPVDPMTGYAITWQTEIGRSVGGDGIMDIHSGSIELSALSKSPYNTW
jgi:hypothetical protein